jgi:acetyl esterase/lipase
MRIPALIVPLCFASALQVVAQTDDAARRELIQKTAERSQVEVRLDQAYAGNANERQMLDVYLPKQRKNDKPLPVVAFIHGGGWIHGDRRGSASGCIGLARTGDYAAVGIGYRLTNEAHWPAQIYDCKAAIRWIRGHAKELNLDADKIAVWGSSAGGHLSSLLGTSGGVKEIEGDLGPFVGLSSRVACVVNWCGPEDLTKPIMYTPNGEPVVKDDAVMGLLGGTFEEKHAEAVAASPLTYVSSDDPPFLNAQGTKDQRVDYKNAEWIHAALKKAGVSSLLIPITDGGHGSVNNAELKRRSEQFVALHLRGLPEEISTAPIPADVEKKK